MAQIPNYDDEGSRNFTVGNIDVSDFKGDKWNPGHTSYTGKNGAPITKWIKSIGINDSGVTIQFCNKKEGLAKETAAHMVALGLPLNVQGHDVDLSIVTIQYSKAKDLSPHGQALQILSALGRDVDLGKGQTSFALLDLTTATAIIDTQNTLVNGQSLTAAFALHMVREAVSAVRVLEEFGITPSQTSLQKPKP